MKNKMKTAILICITSMLLSACGSKEIEEVSTRTHEAETEIEETVETPSPTPTPKEEEPKAEATPDPTPEPEKTYIEEHGLEFFDGSAVEIKGLAMNAFDYADYIETKASFELKNITVSDAESEGYEITVEQVVKGYRWFDGTNKKTDVSLPTVFVADAYTGLIVPNETMHYDMESEQHILDVEWDGEIYHISYTEKTECDLENKWTPMEDGNYAGWCTVYDTLTINIPKNYDGLVLLLPPVLSIREFTRPDEHIMDYWADEDSYLFKVDVNAETENTENVSEDVSTEKNETATTTSTTAPKQEKTKTQETKPQTTPKQDVVTAHSHSYAESITANPTCSTAGTKVFTCSCGDSYSESIPANGNHQWVQNSQVIHHDSKGHMESREVTTNSFECAGCGAHFSTADDLQNHLVNDGTCLHAHWWIVTETGYENEWIVDSEAYDETVTYNVCSVCGATQ